eukprot:gene2334-4871_t
MPYCGYVPSQIVLRVRLKHKAAEECGFQSFQLELPEDVSQEALEAKIQECNNNPEIHGLIVQLPLRWA